MPHVILDTDIGTDVDDLLALVFLAHARERLRVRVSYEKTEDHFLFIDKCGLQKNRALETSIPKARCHRKSGR